MMLIENGPKCKSGTLSGRAHAPCGGGVCKLCARTRV